LALYWSFSSGVGVNLAQLSGQLKARADTVPDEMYQTLLTNKQQRNLDNVNATNIITPTQTGIDREKYTFFVIKSLEP
jgi:hypothetical protein